MNIAQIKELIKDKADDEQMVIFLYERHEANEHIFNNFAYGETQPEITDQEWLTVVEQMNQDDSVWQAFSESFTWSLDALERKRQQP